MNESSVGRRVVRFGVFEVDLQAGELRKSGVKIKLQEQPFQILAMLLERPGEVVTREELRERLWPADTFVDFDHGLNTAINKLREALGDSAETPCFIETLPRRGYRFIYPVEGLGVPARPAEVVPETAAPAAPRVRLRQVCIAALALVALVAFLVGLNVGKLRQRLSRSFGSEPVPGPITSLAVLPLDNLSGDPEQEYFADGMTEALITELGKISALRVISRRSVMQYKGTNKPVPEIARELNVEAVVEGSALRAGEKVRISAQLIRAVPERHLWAESYEHDLSDILGLQREVARAIAGEIRVTLTQEEQVRLASAPRVNPAAHEAYLKGCYCYSQWAEVGLQKAIEQFQQAVDIDPAYAPAYAGLAHCYSLLGLLAYLPPQQAFPGAKAAALKALELHDTLAEAHAALGQVKFIFDWDWVGSERAFKRALELNPNSVDALLNYTFYLILLGRFDEGIAANQRAIELDPLTPTTSLSLGWAYHKARRYDESIAQLRSTLALSPELSLAHLQLAGNYAAKQMYAEAIAEGEKALAFAPSAERPVVLGTLGWVYGVAGKRDAARKLLEQLQALSTRRYVDPWYITLVYTGLGEKELALRWLRKAYEEHSASIVFLKVDPVLDSLRDDARFQALLRRMNFPQN